MRCKCSRLGDIMSIYGYARVSTRDQTRDLLNVLEAVSKRGAGFKSLHDAWADATTPHGWLLTVLRGLAEIERELSRARTGEGRKRAKARASSLGGRAKLTPHQRREALERLAAGETQADIATARP